jgi:hypothetical protein
MPFMHKQLTLEQIDSLYTFCVQHYVRQYDVQVELVDHLTNAIEQIWQTNPNLSFEQAALQVHASFGIKGFADIVVQKSEALDKQHKAARRKILYQFFTWPKAMFTVMMVLLFVTAVQVLSLATATNILYIAFAAILVIETGYTISWHKQKKSTKELLLLGGAEIFSGGFVLPLQILFQVGNTNNQSLLYYYVLAAILLCSTLVFFASYQYSKQVMQMAKQQYPLAFTQ